MNTNTMIALLLVGAFVFAVGVRAWTNTQRILAERHLQARLSSIAAYVPAMPAAVKAAQRAQLTTAAGGDLFAVDEPIPFLPVDHLFEHEQEMAAYRRRCAGYARTIHGGQ